MLAYGIGTTAAFWFLQAGRAGVAPEDDLGPAADVGRHVPVPVAWPQWAKAVPAYGIGTMAAFWFLQRAVSLM